MDSDTQKTLIDINLKLTEHDQHFAEVKAQLTEHDQHFAEVRAQLTEHDQHFAEVRAKLTEHDQRFDQVDERFAKVDERFDKLEERMDKTDEFIVESFNAVYAKFEESKEENRRHFEVLLEHVSDLFRPFRDKGYEHDDRLGDHEVRISKLERSA